MPAQLRKLSSLFLTQLPTVFSLTLLAALAVWGSVWDWKIPSLPVLLDPSLAKKSEEPDKKEDKNEPKKSTQSLPPIQLASEDALTSAGIVTGPVEEQMVGEYVTANGELDFDQDRYAHLSTRASGTAWSVHKRAGDAVKKDDVLALIAAPDLAKLKFDLQQTLLSVQTRRQYYARLQSGGTTTAVKDLEIANSSLREARIRLSNDQQSLQNLGLTIAADELARLSDDEVLERLHTLGIPSKLLQDRNKETMTNNLLPMYAPFDGLVIKRDIVRGEAVNPGTPQFVLADLSQLWILLRVRLEDAGKLRRDQEVTFHLDGPNEDVPPVKIGWISWSSSINWISAEVDEKTRTVAVRADVFNPHGQLRPHTFGTARILIHQEKHVIVPNEALQVDGGVHYVFARGETKTEFQPLRVTVGPRHENFTVILSGVEAGRTIAIAGTRELLSEMLKERISGED